MKYVIDIGDLESVELEDVSPTATDLGALQQDAPPRLAWLLGAAGVAVVACAVGYLVRRSAGEGRW